MPNVYNINPAMFGGAGTGLSSPSPLGTQNAYTNSTLSGYGGYPSIPNKKPSMPSVKKITPKTAIKKKQSTSGYGGYTPRGNYTASELAKMWGIDIDKDGIASMLQDKTNEQYKQYLTEIGRARDEALMADSQTYDRYLDDMRGRRADQIQSGATSGVNAAQEIMAMLGAQQSSSQGQNQANQRIMDASQEQSTQIKADAIMAEQMANERRQMLAGLGVNMRGQDLSHAASMANVGLAQQRLAMEKQMQDRANLLEDQTRAMFGDQAFLGMSAGMNYTPEQLSILSGGRYGVTDPNAGAGAGWIDKNLLGYDPYNPTSFMGGGFLGDIAAWATGNSAEYNRAKALRDATNAQNKSNANLSRYIGSNKYNLQ